MINFDLVINFQSSLKQVYSAKTNNLQVGLGSLTAAHFTHQIGLDIRHTVNFRL